MAYSDKLEKRTGIKLEISNGLKYITRCVYEDSWGNKYVKIDGEKYAIYDEPNGGYSSVWFRVVGVVDK